MVSVLFLWQGALSLGKWVDYDKEILFLELYDWVPLVIGWDLFHSLLHEFSIEPEV